MYNERVMNGAEAKIEMGWKIAFNYKWMIGGGSSFATHSQQISP